MKYKNFIFFLPISYFMLQSLILWQKCRDLTDSFHFSGFDIKLQLEDAIHNDQNVPFFIIHFFHNKIVASVINIFNYYLHYLDFNFILTLLSPIGLVGVILGLWFLVTQKRNKKLRFSLLGLFLLAPFIEIFFPHHLRFQTILFVAIPFILVAFYGYLLFLNRQKNFILLIISFILLSYISYYWILFFVKDISRFCYLLAS